MTAARARVRGGLLAVSLFGLGAIGWVGEGRSTAAAPAELISVDPKSGTALTSYDYTPSISGDGSIVVFSSGGTYGSTTTIDAFVYFRNRANGTTTMVPRPPNVGNMTNGAISRDGCHIAFWGFFIPGFIPPQWLIYTWNRCTPNNPPVPISASTTLGSADYAGSLAVSADGRYVAYYALKYDGSSRRVAWIDTATATESALAHGYSYISGIDISDDGKFVAISGQLASQPNYQVLGWQPPCIAGATVACKTEIDSVRADGQSAAGFNRTPSVSADGRYVAFASDSAELPGGGSGVPQIYVRDRVAGVTKLVTDTPGQPPSLGLYMEQPDISPDGTQIAMSGMDNSETSNVYVARSTSGYFDAAAFDLVSYDVTGNPVSAGSGADAPSMSSNGRYVAFVSQANVDLSGGSVPYGSTEIWLRDRPVALDITPTVDFGQVLLGTQSAPKNVVVTNTSGVQINIAAVAPPAAPFSVIANTCGGVVLPAATCIVTIVFRPTTQGSSSSSVTVSGDGLSVSSSLVGTGRGLGALSIKPSSASYGSAVVGTVIAPKDFVATNTGSAAVIISNVALAGPGADQFSITANGCTGTLVPGGSCTVSVGATVTRNGSFSASLRISGAGGELGQATLRLGGDFQPTLKMNPGVVSPGEVTVAIGEGFPANIDVQLGFDGEAEPFATVHTDGDGAFRYQWLVLRNGIRIGGRQVMAYDQPAFSGVKAPLLIDLATYRPSGFQSASFASTVRSMYTRGG